MNMYMYVYAYIHAHKHAYIHALGVGVHFSYKMLAEDSPEFEVQFSVWKTKLTEVSLLLQKDIYTQIKKHSRTYISHN